MSQQPGRSQKRKAKQYPTDSTPKRQRTNGRGVLSASGDSTTPEDVSDEEPAVSVHKKVPPPNPWIGMNQEQLDKVRGERMSAVASSATRTNRHKDSCMQNSNSTLYALFEKPTIELCDDGRICLMFKCINPECKNPTATKRRQRHDNKANNTSTGRLRNHIISCWGEEKYNEVIGTKKRGPARMGKRATQAKLEHLFGTGEKPFAFSDQNHVPHEVRCV